MRNSKKTVAMCLYTALVMFAAVAAFG